MTAFTINTAMVRRGGNARVRRMSDVRRLGARVHTDGDPDSAIRRMGFLNWLEAVMTAVLLA